METSEIISLVSVTIAFIVAVVSIYRNSREDHKQDDSKMTTGIVQLETIKDGIKDIKADVKDIKGEVEVIKERLVAVEQSAKSAHKRIDMIEEKIT